MFLDGMAHQVSQALTGDIRRHQLVTAEPGAETAGQDNPECLLERF
jgi:hypothetical protein